MRDVKWGVIGLGEQATQRVIPAMEEIDGVRLCCVCTGSGEKAAAVREKHPEAQCFASLDELLESGEIDVLYIATPHQLHVPHAFQAINSGKHVLVEKPLSMSVDGAKKLIEAAKKKEVILGVGYQLRHHSGLKVLKQMIDDDEIGSVELIIANIHQPVETVQAWKRETLHAGPAGLMHLGVHALDLILWMKGEQAQEVVTSSRSDDTKDGYANSVSMLMSFEDGAQAVVAVSNMLPGTMNQLVIIGSGAQVCADLGWPPSVNRQTVIIKRRGAEEKKEFEAENLFARELQAFSEAVRGEGEFSPGGSDNLAVVELTCAAIEAINSKRAVKVGDILRITG